jgi:hypothetical protein
MPSMILPIAARTHAACGFALCGLWLEQGLDRAHQYEPATADGDRLQLSLGDQFIDRCLSKTGDAAGIVNGSRQRLGRGNAARTGL